MEALEAIHTRRSIRSYEPRPVDEATIRECLAAAMTAPSAGNQQPWQFVVLTDRKILDQIPTFHPHAPMLPGAPAAIVVAGDLSRERYKGFWVQDCSAATENLLLAAHTLGLGAVWVGLYPEEGRVVAMRRLLAMPDSIVPFALIPLGWTNQKGKRLDRFDATRIHWNRWTS